MSTEIQIPTGISGAITPLSGVIFCMGDATHLIHSVIGATRLKARNELVAGLLDQYADGKAMVTVMGFPL